LALSRQMKEKVLDQYKNWLDRSEAVYVVEYTGLSVKALDGIRSKIRETGGEFHILKNTLAKKAFEAGGVKISNGIFEKSTAVTFAFSDPASTAKALTEVMKTTEAIKIKGGFLDKQALSVDQVKALADLPPLPVVQAQLLGVLQAPAGKLVRTLAEPARALAFIIGSRSENASTAA
jgi:large subunit ribosomal protein L10